MKLINLKWKVFYEINSCQRNALNGELKLNERKQKLKKLVWTEEREKCISERFENAFTVETEQKIQYHFIIMQCTHFLVFTFRTYIFIYACVQEWEKKWQNQNERRRKPAAATATNPVASLLLCVVNPLLFFCRRVNMHWTNRRCAEIECIHWLYTYAWAWAQIFKWKKLYHFIGAPRASQREKKNHK